MKTHSQLETDLLQAEKAYQPLSEHTVSIKRQLPHPQSSAWHELRVLEEQRRSALWAYNRIFVQLQDVEQERKEA
jgi:hypothetical protein